MSYYRIKGISVTVIMSLALCNTYAWGRTGHHLVADIANSIMNPAAKENVQMYLGNISFEEASVWMDEQRSDHTYDYMKPWHYINIEKGGSYVPDNGDNIMDRLNITYKELQLLLSLKRFIILPVRNLNNGMSVCD